MTDGLGAAAALAPALGPWVAGSILLTALLRAWQPFRKMKVDRDGELVATLITRVEKLETDLAGTRESLEAQLRLERAKHNGVMALMRHRLNNVTACLDALLMLLEHDPSRAAEAVKRIKEMRGRQAELEASEKNAVIAASIAAAAHAVAPVDEADLT